MKALARSAIASFALIALSLPGVTEEAMPQAVKPSAETEQYPVIAPIVPPPYLKAAFDTLLKSAGTSLANGGFTPLKCRKVVTASEAIEETCFVRWGYAENESVSAKDHAWSDGREDGAFVGGTSRGYWYYRELSAYPPYTESGSVGGIISLSGKNGHLVSAVAENRLQTFRSDVNEWLSMTSVQLAQTQRVQWSLLETLARCDKPEEHPQFIATLLDAWPHVLAHPLHDDHKQYAHYRKVKSVDSSCGPVRGERTFRDTTTRWGIAPPEVIETLSISLAPQREG